MRGLMPTFTPAIELPDIYDPYPDDLLVACIEVYKGISAMEIRRKIKPGSHKLLCKVKLQEKPSATQTPPESAEEICEIAMQVVQYDQLANADPAEYKVTFYGAPNRSNGSRMQRSCNVLIGDPDGIPKSINALDEGSMLTMAHGHIAQLYQMNMGLMQVVSGMTRPLLGELKEMARINSEMQRKSVELEQLRISHDLKMKEIEDDKAMAMAEMQRKQERDQELIDIIKQTGAIEAAIGMAAKYFDPSQKAKRKSREEKAKRKFGGAVQNDFDPSRDPRKPAQHPAPPTTLPVPIPSRSVAKTATDEPIDTTAEEAKKTDDVPNAEDLPDEPTQEDIDEAMKMADENPLVLIAKALSMSLEQNDQWKTVYDTLDDDQSESFDRIAQAETDDDVYDELEFLKSTNMGKLIQLRGHLNDEQRKYIDGLLQAAMTGRPE